MRGGRGAGTSYWLASAKARDHPALREDIEVDVAVVGAGIVGVTLALLLKQAGRRVALLDMKEVGRGATGYTTAKVTSGHSLIYGRLEREHGPDIARAYADANQSGLEFIARLIEEESIACDFDRRANYVYTESERDVASIQREVEAARRAGLNVSFVTESTLPFPIAGAVRLDNQAQFHPYKYVRALVDRLPGAGSHVFEHTRVTKVEEGAICVVHSPAGTVRAEHVVLATHYPFLDRGLFFPRIHPKRSYAVAGPMDPSKAPEGMFITSTEPIRSIRTITDGDRTLLMVGGEGHSVGREPSTERRYDRLERWAAERFGVETIEHRWSTQDGVSVDGIPYVGTYTRCSKNVFTATAFGKWGLTNGTAAAMLIRDRILERPNSWADLFNPHRLTFRASATRFATENTKVAIQWLGDRLKQPSSDPFALLAPGQASVERVGLELVAGFRDETGMLKAVSAVCTHLGCVVAWNSAEKSWDCPCHGSRFDVEGGVIEGPAVKNLPKRDVSSA